MSSYASMDELIHAVERGNVTEVQNLLLQGIDPRIKDQLTGHLFSLAIRLKIKKKQNDMVRVLLESGLDPNIKDSYGNHVLFSVLNYYKSPELIPLLIEYGANPGLETDGYKSSLFWAVEHNKLELADLLLSKGANPNLQQYGRKTPLHNSIARGNKDMVELLLYYNADTSLRDQNGFDGYNYALNHGHPEIAELIQSYPFSNIKEPGVD